MLPLNSLSDVDLHGLVFRQHKQIQSHLLQSPHVETHAQASTPRVTVETNPSSRGPPLQLQVVNTSVVSTQSLEGEGGGGG